MTAAAPKRSRVRRHPERARYGRDEVYAILDETWVAHVGLVDADLPVVLPMVFAREGDHLFLHGAPGSRLIRAMGGGAPLCVTATVVDGLVAARCGLRHSVNFRSAVVFGRGRRVAGRAARERALAVVMDRILPGRSSEVRPATDVELRSTTVVQVEIEEVSAKVRSGGPADVGEDLAQPVWAGVVPLTMAAGEPIPSPDMAVPRELPASVRTLLRRQGLDEGGLSGASR